MLEVIEPFLDEWRGRSPGAGAAFRDWAVSQVLLDYSLSWQEIQEVTQIDRPGEMGIDGWYLSTTSTPPVLHLFQSKEHSLKTAHMSHLRSGFLSLFNQTNVSHASEEAKRRAGELDDLHLEDLTIEMYAVTADIVGKPLKDYALSLQAEGVHLWGRQIPMTFHVYDGARLSENIQVVHPRPIDVQFELAKSDLFTFTTNGKFDTATAVVPALALVRVFDRERTNLFRLNPRYRLKSTTNGKVLEALLDDRRKNFFMFNNGVTAVCGGVTVDYIEQRAILRATDFQIANGCQTTATLHDAWKKKGDAHLAGVHVLVRFIESASPVIADQIAITTNSQNPVRPEDFKSNDDIQKNLHEQFMRLQPPWFYEHKRGIWTTEYSKKVDRAPFRENDGSLRHLEMKDLGQACLAFLGRPADAIDRAASIFNSAKASQDDRGGTYEEIFPARIQAQQLLLAYRLFIEADKVTRELKAKHVWAPYLRFPLTSAISTFLHDALGVSQGTYFSTAVSRTLLETMDAWVSDLLEWAQEAFVEAVDPTPPEDGDGITKGEQTVATKQSGIGARSLVRRREWWKAPYQQFSKTVSREIERGDRFARRKGIDPSLEGFRSQFPFPIKE